MNPFDNITITENVSLTVFSQPLSQTGLSLNAGSRYRLYTDITFPTRRAFYDIPLNQLSGGATFGYSGNAKEASEIVAQENVTLNAVGVWVNRVNGNPVDNLVLNIYQGGATPEAGTLVAGPITFPMTELDDGTIFYGATDGNDCNVVFTLPSPLDLVSGTTYFYVLTRSGSLDLLNSPSIRYDSDGPFTGYHTYTDRWNQNWTEFPNSASGFVLFTDLSPSIVVKENSSVVGTLTESTQTFDFTSGGANTISFTPTSDFSQGSITHISLKEFIQEGIDDNIPVKEFLTGTTDEGREIIFRADSQPIQLTSQFEFASNPLAIINRVQRGTLLKCFVSLDGEDFYEIQGTLSKGVSILKIHSKDKAKIPSPPVAQKIQISWRDGSKQLCRLIQSAIVFIPGTMEYTQ